MLWEGGGGETLIPRIALCLKEEDRGTLPCTGEERGRQTRARGRWGGAGALRGTSLLGGEERLLWALVSPATVQSYWASENLRE